MRWPVMSIWISPSVPDDSQCCSSSTTRASAPGVLSGSSAFGSVFRRVFRDGPKLDRRGQEPDIVLSGPTRRVAQSNEDAAVLHPRRQLFREIRGRVPGIVACGKDDHVECVEVDERKRSDAHDRCRLAERPLQHVAGPSGRVAVRRHVPREKHPGWLQRTDLIAPERDPAIDISGVGGDHLAAVVRGDAAEPLREVWPVIGHAHDGRAYAECATRECEGLVGGKLHALMS